MPRHLFLFNPENDLALASDVPHYTAPPLPRRLRADLALLPLWLAGKDDVVAARAGSDARRYLDFVSANLGIEAHCCEQIPQSRFRCLPWGWSRSVRREFQQMGLTDLPDDRLLAQLRLLSARATSVRLLSMLGDAGVDVPPAPLICRSSEEVAAAVGRFRKAVLKQPWSSSGRGVTAVEIGDIASFNGFIAGTLRRQKYVVCEPLLEKEQDFAMEFFCSERGVEFVGYSVFFNNAVMSYDHASVASTDRLRRHLLQFAAAHTLQRLEHTVRACLQEILPESYYGYAGVDMMVYRDENGGMRINPCVEMNLRTTMGVVSSALGNRILAPDTVARMDVLYHKTSADVQRYLSTLQSPVFAGQKLAAGTLPLAPVTGDTRYTATLTVTNS